jgi:hypothetical protein
MSTLDFVSFLFLELEAFEDQNNAHVLELTMERQRELAESQLLECDDLYSKFTKTQLEKLRHLVNSDSDAYIVALHVYLASQSFVVPIVHEFTVRGLEHYENSCYVNAMISSMFTTCEAFDAILTKGTHLTASLLLIVNILRRGLRVPSALIAVFIRVLAQTSIIPERELHEQQDVNELFSLLLDHVQYEMLTIKQIIHHGESVDKDDRKSINERSIVLPLVENVRNISGLLDEYCFNTTIDGLIRRNEDGKDSQIKALVTLISPKNTPTIFPMVLKRYDQHGKKMKQRIALPFFLDATGWLGLETDCTSFIMVLKSVICHGGSKQISSGHFVCYTSEGPSPLLRWIKLDDLQNSTEYYDSYYEMLEKNYKDIFHKAYLILYELVSISEIGGEEFEDFIARFPEMEDSLENEENCIIQ